jgi:hypothetical protein
MVTHCLRVDEYKEVLNVNFLKNKQTAELEYIQELFNSCQYWDNKLVGINYFFSLAVESLQRHNNLTSDVIEFIYELQEMANFQIQEMMPDFIGELYNSYNSDGLTIEEKLIEVQRFIDEKFNGS